MATLQIWAKNQVSAMCGLRVMIFWVNFTPAEKIWGVAIPQRVQPAKPNFLGRFRVFSRILELQKIFSLHPNTHNPLQHLYFWVQSDYA